MDTQAKGFELQFELAERSGLPVFFHSRACREDFADMIRRNRDRFAGGVVHSFTGTREMAGELVSMGVCVHAFWRASLPRFASCDVVGTVAREGEGDVREIQLEGERGKHAER